MNVRIRNVKILLNIGCLKSLAATSYISGVFILNKYET